MNWTISNLVPRVLSLFGQWMGTRKTLDNKDINQISEPSSFLKNMSLVGVPILTASQTWFQSLLFKNFQLGAHLLTKKTDDSGYEIGLFSVGGQAA